MTRFIAACLLSLAALTSRAADYYWLGPDLNLTGQFNWGLVTNVDAPIPGAWQTQLLTSGSPITNANSALVTNLTGNINAGTYRAFVKILGYDLMTNITMTLGSSTTTNHVVDDRNYDKKWTDLGMVTNASPVNFLRFDVQRGASGVRPLVYAILLTSNLGISLTDDDFMADFTVPTVLDSSAAISGNSVRNGGFEVGVSGWSVNMNERPFDFNLSWDTNVFLAGTASLKIPMTADPYLPAVYSLPMKLRTNKVHTISAYVKTDMTAPFGLRLSLVNVFPNPGNLTAFAAPTQLITATTNWTRMSVTMTNWNYPYNEWEAKIEANNAPAIGNWWVDNVQVEEGAVLNTWRQAEAIELGLRSEMNGHIHFSDEDYPLTLRASNNGLPRTYPIQVTFYNNDQIVVSNILFSFTMPTGITSTNISLAGIPLGDFRAVAYIVDTATPAVEEECIFSKVVRPRVSTKTTAGLFGAHPKFHPYLLTSMDRIGVKWIRALSPEAAFRMTVAEPTEGNYVYYDTHMLSASNSMGTVIANIGEQVPTWAQRRYFPLTGLSGAFQVGEVLTSSSGATARISYLLTTADPTGNALQITNIVGTFAVGNTVTGGTSGATATISVAVFTSSVALDKWGAFCTQMATHYAPLGVHWWEIWNEPNQKNGVGGNMPETVANVPAFYATATQIAVSNIYNIDTNAHFIIFGGVTSLAWMTNCWNFLDANTRLRIDRVSVHLYDPNGAGSQALVDGWVKVYNVPLINSESGTWDFSYYSGPNSNVRYQGNPLTGYKSGDRFYRTWHINPEIVARNFSQSIGSGMTNVDYYDARSDRHLNYQDSNTSMLDYDGSITPKGIAVASLATTFDGGMGRGKLSLTNLLEGYMFTNYLGTPVASIWSISRDEYRIGMSTTNFSVYDSFGNLKALAPSTNLLVSRTPVFVYAGSGLSESTFSNSLLATPVIVPDVTPPNVVITYGPLGFVTPLHNHTMIFSFAGVDNKSIPDTTWYNALQYRTRIPTIDPAWSAWTNTTYLRLISPPDGVHVLTVEGRDEAGNVSSATRSFRLGAAEYVYPLRLPPSGSGGRRRRL